MLNIITHVEERRSCEKYIEPKVDMRKNETIRDLSLKGVWPR